jgi:quinol monooxygenase YgiN
MLVVIRFRVGIGEEESFLAEADTAIASLARQPGHLAADLGRATDDPQLWVLTMRWANVGSYRRALSAYDVKTTAVPLLSRAIDEPTAFEVIRGSGATEPNRAEPRGSQESDAGTLRTSPPSHRQTSRTE